MKLLTIRNWIRPFIPDRLRRMFGARICALWNNHLIQREKRLSARLYSTRRISRQRKRIAKLLRGKRNVSIAFQITTIAKWKYESVLRLLLELPHVHASVWVVPLPARESSQKRERELAQIRNHFAGSRVSVTTAKNLLDFPRGTMPDIVFLHEAYDYVFDLPYNEGIMKLPLCYVPYCFRNTMGEKAYNGLGNLAAAYNFYENDYMANLASTYAENKGANICVSGQPIADAFLFPSEEFGQAWKSCGANMKKVIWAPHWTITEEYCWFARGTFLRTAHIMLELAQKYSDRIQFAFKPHPHLHRILLSLPEWGKERTEQYYRQWAEMPNTQIEEGEYTALFMQSDAMIHDCGSFRLEYLFADKPCMYLRDAECKEDYNQMSKDALSCYHIGSTQEEIDAFLQKCVLGGEDPLAERRAVVRKMYIVPPNGVSAAQNIVNTLLKGE